jgi:uncharacterized protein (DUF433 family)
LDPAGTIVAVGTLLNRGIYDGHEVAHLLAVDVERVVRWATPDTRGNPPIAAPSLGRAFAFEDLVTLAVAFEIRHRGVPEVQIRRGLQVLRDELHLDQPLAHRPVLDTVATSGSSLVAQVRGAWLDVGRGRQGTFEDIVMLYLTRLSFDDAGVATAWAPAPYVLLDPRIQAGAPCVAGTRIPTATIHALLDDESVDEVADEYGLTVEHVDAADKFEKRLDDGVGLAA